MAAYGFDASLRHEENGMPAKDMRATLRVAENLDEVIVFRSTGPWSRRWIDKGYPTKNFHVKGKSSDWGPQAGLVPYLGIYSKVGADAGKAAAGTRKNDDGMSEQFADKVQLKLTLGELHMQLNDPEELPARRALYDMQKIHGTNDYFLLAKRSGDGLMFVFKAVYDRAFNNYAIFVYPDPWRRNLAEVLTTRPGDGRVFARLAVVELARRAPATVSWDPLQVTRISAQPDCPPVTFFAGQPMLMSIMSAPAASESSAPTRIHSGSRPAS